MILRNKRRRPPNAFLGKKPNLDAATGLGCFFKGRLQVYFEWVKINGLLLGWMSSDVTRIGVNWIRVRKNVYIFF